MKWSIKAILTWFTGMILLLILGGLIFGTFIMLLWNWLMPDIFGVSSINILQAIGLYYLFQIFMSFKLIKTEKN